MTSWQKISLLLALISASFLSGIGIFIAEASLAGILLCLFGAIMTPGIGFMLKKRFIGKN
ncbi:DUF5325 family protein [Ammoniphilus sp. 3BR4]|uniref:DUF5325 family protein n=1 Tax=Ammoniphilus sp. 3BR4 TaxID=3158265 RepID=UPI003466D085